MPRWRCRCSRRWPTLPASAGPLTITAWILGHGLALLVSPTNVVVVGGLAIAKVGYDKYLRFVWPLLAALTRRGQCCPRHCGHYGGCRWVN